MYMFIARDQDGDLWMYDRKPELSQYGRMWLQPDHEAWAVRLRGDFFRNITFDDGPVKIKIEIATENIK